jgi:hypothetical protein
VLVGVELALLTWDDVDVAVQEYAGLPRADPHDEGGEVALRAAALVTHRFQIPRLEPAVDEVDR